MTGPLAQHLIGDLERHLTDLIGDLAGDLIDLPRNLLDLIGGLARDLIDLPRDLLDLIGDLARDLIDLPRNLNDPPRLDLIRSRWVTSRHG